MNSSRPAPGFVSSLRQLADGIVATVQDRVTLISLELQEEKEHALQAHLWLSVAIYTGLLAVMFGSLTLVYLFWEWSPLAALGALTVLYTIACVSVAVGLRRRLRRQPRPFAATLAELEKDRSCTRQET